MHSNGCCYPDSVFYNTKTKYVDMEYNLTIKITENLENTASKVTHCKW